MEADTICGLENWARMAANRLWTEITVRVQKPMIHAVFRELSGFAGVYPRVGWLSHSASGAL